MPMLVKEITLLVYNELPNFCITFLYLQRKAYMQYSMPCYAYVSLLCVKKHMRIVLMGARPNNNEPSHVKEIRR